jgi:hypothetical protein
LLQLGVGIESSIAGLVATLDLQLVQMLRGAMNAADANACKTVAGVPVAHKRDCFERRPVIDPTPRIEGRKVYHPTPRIEPRPVIRPTARVEKSNACLPPVPTEVEPGEKTKSPILPPWKTLPCENKQPAPVQIKMVVQRPDIQNKGSLIDLFI